MTEHNGHNVARDERASVDLDARLHNVEHMLVHLHDEGEKQAEILLGHRKVIEALARRLERAEAYGREVHGQLDGSLIEGARDRAGLRQDIDRLIERLDGLEANQRGMGSAIEDVRDELRFVASEAHTHERP